MHTLSLSEIELTYSCDPYKANLLREVGNNARVAFEQLNHSRSGAISPSDIEHFFWSNSVLIYQDEIKGILRRIDLLNDSVIDFYEFTRFLNVGDNSRNPNNSSHFQSSQQKSAFSESPFKDLSSIHRRTQTDANIGSTFGNLRQSYADAQPRDEYAQSQRDRFSSSPQKSPFDRSLLVRSQVQSQVSKSPKKKSPYRFDDTMSNVLTQSKANKNTKLLKAK